MFEILIVCGLAISDLDLADGMTEHNETIRYEFVSRENCERQRDQVELDKTYRDCVAICKVKKPVKHARS